MVPLERFELPTLALRKPCSTPELQRLMGYDLALRLDGAVPISPARD